MIARVPASSANMGPGFDALGMALALYAEVGIVDDNAALPDGVHIADEHHLATVAFARVDGTGTLWTRSAIPMGRGLGYSAAVRVGGLLLGLAQRAGGRGEVSDELAGAVLAHAIELEGHADNAAAAVLGGVVATTGGRSIRVPLRFDPAVVVWVPSFSTRTDQSRTKLPPTVAFADAVFNVGHVAFLVAALAAGDVDALGHATQDRLHQPSRFAAAPASMNAYEAALDAGAWSAWLSGSGPTVAAMCAAESADVVAAAMAATANAPTAAKAAGTTKDVGHTKILRIDHGGATLEL
jgi:homoserine kinase